MGGARVARPAARRHFLLSPVRPLRRGEGGGCREGGDGPRRWGEWRCRRPAWQAARPQSTVAAELEGWGLWRAKRALLHGIVCIAASLPFLTFLWTNFLRWRAPRLSVALAPSLILKKRNPQLDCEGSLVNSAHMKKEQM